MSSPARRSSAKPLESQTVRLQAVLRGAMFLGAALSTGCAATPLPCRSPSACPAGTECLAQRCVPVGAEPVDPASRRLVLEPVAVAVVRAGTARRGPLPATVTLGGPEAQSEQLLLRFREAWVGVDVDTAFLLLQPVADAEPTAEDVALEVAVASGGWVSGSTGDSPSSRAPVSAGVGRTRPAAPLRIDVTAQLKELAKADAHDEGLVVRAAAASARGAVYATGVDGDAPQLDVYFRPRAARR